MSFNNSQNLSNNNNHENVALKSLMEMGIPLDVANDALLKSNGNLENAINFIFSNDFDEVTNSNRNSNDSNSNINNDTQHIETSISTSNNNTINGSNNSNNPFLNDHIQLNSNNSQMKPGDLSHLISNNNNNNNFNTNNSDLNDQSIQRFHTNEYSETTTNYNNDYDSNSNSNSDSDSDSEPNPNSNSDDNLDNFELKPNLPDRPINLNSYDTIQNDHNNNNNNSETPPNYNTSLMNHGIHKMKLNDPTVILPLPPNSMIENYLALFALCLTRYLPSLFVTNIDFKNLNYDPNWFKGLSLQKPINNNEKKNDNKDNNYDDSISNQPELLWQLQRLIAVSNSSLSERSYVSTRLFSIAINSKIQQKLQDSDKLCDILPEFIKSILLEFESFPLFKENKDKMAQIGKNFISTALYKPNDTDPLQETYVLLFHFPPEEYDSNLYKMFNALLLPDDDDDDDYDTENIEQEGQISNDVENSNNNFQAENSLNEISPFLTILFNEIDESTDDDIDLQKGVEIPFEFYPQIYSKTIKNQMIKHIITKRNQAQNQLRKCLQELNNLKSYQGKDIMMFLNSTIDFLQKENDVANVENFIKIKEQIINKKNELKEICKDLSNKLHNEWNISHPEYHIIPSLKQMGLIDEPYHLVMVTISPYLYYLRDQNNKDKWSVVQANTFGTDFQIINNISAMQVQESIKQHTKTANETPIMFNYCKESHLSTTVEIERIIERNQGCLEFNKSDQLYLLANRDV